MEVKEENGSLAWGWELGIYTQESLVNPKWRERERQKDRKRESERERDSVCLLAWLCKIDEVKNCVCMHVYVYVCVPLRPACLSG